MRYCFMFVWFIHKVLFTYSFFKNTEKIYVTNRLYPQSHEEKQTCFAFWVYPEQRQETHKKEIKNVCNLSKQLYTFRMINTILIYIYKFRLLFAHTPTLRGANQDDANFNQRLPKTAKDCLKRDLKLRPR